MGGYHGYAPLFACCPHLPIACFAVNGHLPSILNIAYRLKELNEIINNQS